MLVAPQLYLKCFWTLPASAWFMLGRLSSPQVTLPLLNLQCPSAALCSLGEPRMAYKCVSLDPGGCQLLTSSHALFYEPFSKPAHPEVFHFFFSFGSNACPWMYSASIPGKVKIATGLLQLLFLLPQPFSHHSLSRR